MIDAVQSREVTYYSFTASDIKVRVYRDLAVATTLWSMRGMFKGQRIDTQMRVMHIYMYTGAGYRVMTAQTTLLPPYLQQPL
jgi:ketosteroid isomerase-like protein